MQNAVALTFGGNGAGTWVGGCFRDSVFSSLFGKAVERVNGTSRWGWGQRHRLVLYRHGIWLTE